MVLSATTDLAPPHQKGLRQIDVRRDLRAVADLVGDAFADELDDRGQASLRELRSLSRLGPLLYLMVPTSGELGGFLRGFVWEADGEIVGNVTLQQADDSGSRWMIANVAVHPDYRGQGIAGSLMQAALTRIKEMGGDWALLQVKKDNEIARKLYDHMGFDEVVTESHLRILQMADIPDTALPANVSLVRLYDRDWDAMKHLLHRSVPTSARWLHPTRSRAYRRNSDPHLILRWGHLIGLSQRERLGVYRGSDLMGALDVWSQPHGEHEISILLHPDVQEEWTETLLHHGLRRLQRYPYQPITATLYDYQPQATAALKSLGFRTTRTLATMRKRISKAGRSGNQ
jgi:ribosomal protein S18 acetylase RimI-like enzyme